jgi:hypothetical protein
VFANLPRLPHNNKKKKKFSFYGSKSFSSSFVARNTQKYSNKTRKTKERVPFFLF